MDILDVEDNHPAKTLSKTTGTQRLLTPAGPGQKPEFLRVKMKPPPGYSLLGIHRLDVPVWCHDIRNSGHKERHCNRFDRFQSHRDSNFRVAQHSYLRSENHSKKVHLWCRSTLGRRIILVVLNLTVASTGRFLFTNTNEVGWLGLHSIEVYLIILSCHDHLTRNIPGSSFHTAQSILGTWFHD